MNREIIIREVDNGYVVSHWEEDENITTVIEIDYDTAYGKVLRVEQLALRKLFYAIRDILGVYNDKHEDQYLDITVSGEDDD